MPATHSTENLSLVQVQTLIFPFNNVLVFYIYFICQLFSLVVSFWMSLTSYSTGCDVCILGTIPFTGLPSINVEIETNTPNRLVYVPSIWHSHYTKINRMLSFALGRRAVDGV